MFLVQIQLFWTSTGYDLEILHHCDKSVKAVAKVLKELISKLVEVTGTNLVAPPPPPPPIILNRVKTENFSRIFLLKIYLQNNDPIHTRTTKTTKSI